MHDKTREILNLFETINTIPRCSKNEDKIAQWLQRWANDREFGVQKDSAGNIKIKVPARQTAGQQAGIIIQGHMDMVCEKTDESDHDFSSDPVRCVYDGDWLRSEKTSLGADNGIAIALALSVADDPGVAHPPLELLFTVDEESGLLGAKAMEPGFLDGDILLNVDSEEDGIFTIGCAGGEETRISLPTNFATLSKNNGVYKIAATGIRGGHSGIDIHKQRASANKILARALQAMEVQNDMHLISIKGGTTHNAIARDAEASVAFQPSHYHRLQEVIKEFERTVRHEYARTETSISVPLSRIENNPDNSTALSAEDTQKVIRLLLALPHGVAGMSADIDGLVETSSNLATIEMKNQSLEILSSQRSSAMSKLDEITATVEAAAVLAGAATKNENRYPAWQPNTASPLLKRCKEVYRTLFAKDPAVQTIHAGLECGIIGSKHKGMDMISFGPTIKNPHSPDEKLYIPSLIRIWDFTVALLKSYTH